MVGGVCGGIAEYFGIDSAIVRIIFLFIVLYGGSGLFVYIILWAVLPSYSNISLSPDEVMEQNKEEIKEKVVKSTKGIKSTVKTDSKK